MSAGSKLDLAFYRPNWTVRLIDPVASVRVYESIMLMYVFGVGKDLHFGAVL